jgi:4Fe-4S binding protein
MTLALLLALLLGLAPGAALAHGDEHGHGAHAGPRFDGTGALEIGGYRVELASEPSPLAPRRRGLVIARISRSEDDAPVSDGVVQIAFERAAGEGELSTASEVTWAGSYAVPVTPPTEGVYRVRVALVALEGKELEPPLVAGFPLAVEPAPVMSGAGWGVIGLVMAIALAAVWVARARGVIGVAGGRRLDLLDVAWIRRVLTSRLFQPALQAPLLVLMVVLVALGLYDVQDGGQNVATKLTWTIWWAAIIFTFFLAGRVWCLACPFGALNEWAARLAAPLRRLPRPLRNIWWATAAFVALTWADEQLGVVRSPRVTALIIVFFAGLAVLIGLFFERRSFCRYLCPIGGLIGIYSMTAPLELRAKDGAVCLAHRDKTCYRGDGTARGCPMFEFPQTMDRNNYCTFCGECVKGCGHDNLALRLRAFGQDLWASRRWLLEESYLAVALVGLTLVVTAQMLVAWPTFVSWLGGALPGAVRASLKPVTYLSLVESALFLTITLVAGPLLVAGGSALAGRLAGGGPGVRRTFAMFGYMFVPVGLALHLAHNVAHLLLEGAGIVPAVQRAVAVYTPWSLGEPSWQTGPLAPAPVVWLVQMSILVAFFVLSLVVGYRLALRAYADPRAAGRAFAPMAALSLLFTVAGVVLLNLPMGMRHGM